MAQAEADRAFLRLSQVVSPTRARQAQLESAIIRHLIPAGDRIVGENASRETVLNALQKTHTTFHFTGHGYYNSLNPENSALALTDKLLTAKEISQLTLSNYYPLASG